MDVLCTDKTGTSPKPAQSGDPWFPASIMTARGAALRRGGTRTRSISPYLAMSTPRCRLSGDDFVPFDPSASTEARRRPRRHFQGLEGRPRRSSHFSTTTRTCDGR